MFRVETGYDLPEALKGFMHTSTTLAESRPTVNRL